MRGFNSWNITLDLFDTFAEISYIFVFFLHNQINFAKKNYCEESCNKMGRANARIIHTVRTGNALDSLSGTMKFPSLSICDHFEFDDVERIRSRN